MLVAAGVSSVAQAMRAPEAAPFALHLRRGRLLLLEAGLSIDNLIVGFALGAYNVSIVLSVTVIAAVSVAMSLIDLELGDRLGIRVEHNSELVAGIVLVGVGAAVAIGFL